MPTPQEKYELYLLNSPDNERVVEVISISHSLLSKTFHMCMEPTGHTVTLETMAVVVAEGRNFTVKKNKSKDDLDERYQFTFDDNQGELQLEAEKIPLDNTEDILIDYRVFMFTDLTEVAIGPIKLKAVNLTYGIGVATIEAQSPSLVENRTGELSTYDRFPTQS